LVILVVVPLSALLGWSAGYDFNTRNPYVRLWVFCAMIVCIDEIKKKRP